LFEQSLYAVTTDRNADSAQKPGTIQQILGNQDYENLKFDLSPDGKTIAIQRPNRSNVEDIGLWVLRPESAPTAQKLLNRPAGEFAIAPDSATIANPQADGIAILSLTPNIKPLDFIPSFRRIFSFTPDGRQSAMLKDNSDFTHVLTRFSTSVATLMQLLSIHKIISIPVALLMIETEDTAMPYPYPN
jgi:hypothetical protein